MKHHFLIGAELNGGVSPSGIENRLSVRRLDGLLQHHQKLTYAGLTGTVGPEEQSDGRHTDIAGILPAFEIPYS